MGYMRDVTGRRLDALAVVTRDEALPTPQRHGAKGDGVADDTAALNAFMAAGYPEGYIPAGTYRTSTGVVQPASMSVILDVAARIKATAAMPALWGGGLSANFQNKFLEGGIFDCNNLAQTGLSFPYFHELRLNYNRVERAAGHAVVLGDPGSPSPGGAARITGLNIWRADGETAPVGSYGLWIRRAYDCHVTNAVIVGAEAAGVRVDVGANFFTEVHVWGYNNAVPQACFDDNADNNTWIACMADTPGQYGFRLRQFRTELIGCHSYMNNTWGSDNVATGIYFDKSAPSSYVAGHYFEGEDATHRLAKDFDSSDVFAFADYVTILGSRSRNVVTANSHVSNVGGQFRVRGYGTAGFQAAGNSSALLNAREAAGPQVLNINTVTPGSPLVAWPNKAKHMGYADNFTTQTWQINGITGGITPGTTAGLGSNIYSGSGAPTIAGAVGDFYFRKDTPQTAGQRIYACTVAGAAGAATWVATAA